MLKLGVLEIDGTYLLSGQYADDMYLILDPTEENLNAVIEELEKFEKFSGLKVNYEKTAVLKVGPFRDSEAKFYTLKKTILVRWLDKNFGDRYSS